MLERIVVTGIGTFTPLGRGREELWRRLLAGESGIGPVESFDTSAYKVHVGAEIKEFKPELEMTQLEPRNLGRASQLAVAAARLAMLDAGIEQAVIRPERTGVVMGTTSGEPQEVERFNDRRLKGELESDRGELITRYPCHVLAGHIAAELELSGINAVVPTACAAGNHALAFAYDALRAGRADLMLAGGADAFSRITYTGFARLGAIAAERCQPFDRQRRGMIPGEGAAVLVLETLSRARARGAHIFAEITGHGIACDAHHMTTAHPTGDGAARAMRQALAMARRTPEQVSYISAHGTGTPTNDRLETIAVKSVFGEAARQVPMSSVKSMLGHTMGAAAAIEAAICVLAISQNQIPPTMNYEIPDPECDLDYVPNVARQCEVSLAMNNASAFGGNNATVVFEQCVP